MITKCDCGVSINVEINIESSIPDKLKEAVLNCEIYSIEKLNALKMRQIKPIKDLA